MFALLEDRLERAGLGRVYTRVQSRQRLSRDDGLLLLSCRDLQAIAALAHLARTQRHGRLTYYNRNRHINYSNICSLRCRFCAFGRDADDPAAYVLSDEEILQRADDAAAVGATELHIVGGLHPAWPLKRYLDLLQTLKMRRPRLHLKAFTAIEINHFARRAGLSVRQTLQALMNAGLDSLPGGGAEILDDGVRAEICPQKGSSAQWLDVHRNAHELGLRSTCTMLYGHVETLQQRVDHLLALRQLQDETGGFQAMVPLRFHPRNTMLSHLRPATGGESLKVHAVARLLLDNVPNIKAFWIMQGVEVSQALLHAGVNDLDGTVSEERITHMAGARTPQGLSVARLHALIEEAGQRPVERDSRYRAVRRQGSDWSTAGALPEAACASAGACAHHVAP